MKRQRISKAIAGLQTTFHHFAYGETVLFRRARYLGVRLAVLRIAKVKFSLLQRRKLIYVKRNILASGSESQVAQRLWRFDPAQLQRAHVQPTSWGVTCTCGRSAFAHCRTWHFFARKSLLEKEDTKMNATTSETPCPCQPCPCRQDRRAGPAPNRNRNCGDCSDLLSV